MFKISKIIDLTQTLSPNSPSWNGQCGFEHERVLDYVDCTTPVKFRVCKLSSDAGIGTHIDAPSHCDENGKNINEIELIDLISPCFVIDISKETNEDKALSVEDIKAFEKQFGAITTDSFVLINTGWSKFWNEPFKYHNSHRFPFITKEAGSYLYNKDIKGIGIDTLSPDRPDIGYYNHELFLKNGKIIIENLNNLESLPAAGALLIALPIKIQGGTEAPSRVIALLPQNRSLL